MVNVSSENNKINITVSSSSNTANVSATPDSARYYSDKSKEWAISEKLIDNEDYSSKYYANESKKQADISTAKVTEVVENGNTAVSNIESARDNAITDITNQESLSVDSVNTAGITQVANVNSAGTTQINLAKEQVTLATNQANIATEQATIATNKTSEVVASGNDALSNIDTAKNGAITDITNHKNTSVSNITTAKNNALASITTQETISKNNVITTGNEQVERVNLTGVDNKTPIFSKSEIETSEGVYKNVYDLKHSTFDLSKFEVVGSPTITDDGIASGFNQTNYLTIPLPKIANQPFKIIAKINTGTPNTMRVVCKLGNTTGANSSFLINTSNDLVAWYVVTDGTTTQDLTVKYSNIPANTDIWVKLENDSTQHWVSISYDGINWFDGVKRQHSLPLETKNYADALIGTWKRATNASDYKNDLKQFSITVDGKEVFNGNKTGLDVIKPDNYTVVGNPVISEDGVVSGYSTRNWVGADYQVGYLYNKSWTVSTVFKYSTLTAANPLFAFDTEISYGGVGVSASSGVLFQGQFGELTTQIVSIKLTSFLSSATIGNRYKVTLDFNINTGLYTLSYKGLDDNISGASTYTPTTTDKQIHSIYLQGTSLIRAVGGVGWTGSSCSIDLNAFKIYVDGNLVYQPCLKIPYTESKTGSKIVDVAYRDRVIDLYKQQGQAGYYTIDESNNNFTLPMGEIYGMIGQRSLISSTVTETNRVDIYSDKTCLICGNVVTAGTINLPIELANNNYFITLSTSAKTATSFTTTATGDYILIGKVI